MSKAGKKEDRRREKPHLEQVGGTGKGRVFELSREMLRIGRTDDNEIVMKSDSVSRCHAYLRRSMNNEWVFQDNSSKNGVRVNGERILESKLADGDLLEIGDFSFKFHEGAQASAPQNQEKTSIAPVFAPPIATPQIDWKEKFQQLRTQWEPRLFAAWKFLEGHSWLTGIFVGLLIGGGFWLKAARVAPRPGAQVRAAEQKATRPVASTPAPLPTPAAVLPHEAVPTPTAEAPTVSKEDLAVSQSAGKKPKSDIRDLKVYLREGKNYLREGDKDSAAIAFRFALVLDPRNREAQDGLRAAGGKVETPKPAAPREDRRASVEVKSRRVASLLKSAVDAFGRRSYQEAIDKAEQARRIEVPGQTEYLNEAKQILDRARAKQKEDFEPFLDSALKKLEQGDYKGSAALCEEMLRTDPAYAAARECLAKSLDGIAGRRVK